MNPELRNEINQKIIEILAEYAVTEAQFAELMAILLHGALLDSDRTIDDSQGVTLTGDTYSLRLTIARVVHTGDVCQKELKSTRH